MRRSNINIDMCENNLCLDFNKIQKECIRDHKSYIKSYIKNHTQNEIMDNYEKGIERYNSMKALMKDVTMHYPQLMGFMLNPSNSGTCVDNLCKGMIGGMNRYGDDVNSIDEKIKNQIGGTKEQMMQVIDKVKHMFEHVKRIDASKMKKITEELLTKLDSIDRRLDQLATDERVVSDPDTVINNLSTVVTSLDKFDPVSRSYTKLNSAYDLYAPMKNFKGIDLDSVTTLNGVLADVIENYIDVIGMIPAHKKIVRAVLTEGSRENLQKNLTSLKQTLRGAESRDDVLLIDRMIIETNTETDISYVEFRALIFAKYIKPIMDKIETELDAEKVLSIDSRYTTIEQTITAKILEIEKLIAKLKMATDNTQKTLYGDTLDPESIKRFASVRSNMLPKIREIMGICRLYSLTVKDDPQTVEVLTKLHEKYASIMIKSDALYRETMGTDLQALIDNLDQYKLELNRGAGARADRLKAALVAFINLCTSSEINKKIALFNEKINDKQLSDFIDLYNKTMETPDGQKIVDKLNIFMAEMYRQLLAVQLAIPESLGNKYDLKVSGKIYCTELEKINRYVTIIRELNVKKIRDIASDPADYSLLRPIFEDILKKAYGYDQKLVQLSTELVRDIKLDVEFVSALGTEIKDERSARLFIHLYNRTMYSRDLTAMMQLGFVPGIRLIPHSCFMKDYTDRIYNNIFKDLNEHRSSKSAMLEDMIEASLKIPSKDAADMIYEPDFRKIKAMMEKDKRKGQIGGNIDTIGKNMIALGTKKLSFADAVERYKKESDRYMIAYNDVYSYTRYLILIATNQFFTENYVVYNYLNKGLIELYKRIITNITKDLDSGVSEPHIVYIRKYYNVIVRRLEGFLNRLSVFMTDSADIIDIRNIDSTSAEIRNDIILLNYFKPIIESYNEIFQNQITIYARLNDIVGEIDYDSKVFVSDHEKYKNVGCGYDVLSNESSPSKLGALCLPAKTADIDMGGNPTIMWTKQESCDAFTGPGAVGAATDQPMSFTEVFDTVNFPENGDISKYMTLETQLAKKKGVCVLTYGYSGTGKTYTLFGNRDKLGVLQSTLVNISGLYKVKFRLFEIYGRGLPYDFYWNDNDANVSRMTKIDHYIFHYRLQTANSMIMVQENIADDLVKIMPDNFLSYIENDPLVLKKRPYQIDDSYISIKGSDVKSVFNNFATFTESIDGYRKGEKGTSDIRNIKRIRETPNNPESSRSILVYDFKLYVGEDTGSGTENEKDAVRFLIIDLPGREEIKQTYIEPYLDNPLIFNMLKDDFDAQISLSSTKTIEANYAIEHIRMIITCMALNPMALGVFHPQIIIDTVNSRETSVRAQVYGDVNGKGDITQEYEVNETHAKLSIFVKLDGMKLKLNEKSSGFGYNTPFQILGVGAIFVVYRLIEQNRFDVLEQIYKNIVKYEINDVVNRKIDAIDTSVNSLDLFNILSGLVETRFKGEKTSKSIDQLVRSLTASVPITGSTTLGYIKSKQPQIVGLKSGTDDEKIKSIKSTLKTILNYDYLMTPLEGIYINENIIGLIKYLSGKLIKDPVARAKIDVLNKSAVQQKKMILVEQRNIARCWLMSRSEDDMQSIPIRNNPKQLTYLQMMFNLFNIGSVYQNSFFPWSSSRKYFNNIYSGLYEYVAPEPDSVPSPLNASSLRIRFDQLVKQQRFLITTYASNKIFNFDSPIITDILSPYIENDKKDEAYNKTAIKDYKLFYLFGNYDENQKTQFKCEHQIKLLKNTENFIKAIAN